MSIDSETVKIVATSVGRRNPGYTHNPAGEGSCKYTYEDGSHCFVGSVILGLGLPLPGVNESPNSYTVSGLNRWLSENGNDTLTDDAVNILTRMQNDADQGLYWDRTVA